MQREPGAAPAESEPTVLDVLNLEEIDRDLYRSTLVFADPFPLYGGQVAAQALLAAGLTVGEGRLPHGLGRWARLAVGADRWQDGRGFHGIQMEEQPGAPLLDRTDDRIAFEILRTARGATEPEVVGVATFQGGNRATIAPVSGCAGC